MVIVLWVKEENMGTIVDAVKLEEGVPPGRIRLITSGSFLRAYNHSAWLFHKCISQFKVTRKHIKSLDREVFFIGFPVDRLLVTIGKREIITSDYGCDVVLSPEEIPKEEEYESWKSTVPVSPTSNADFNSLPLTGLDAEREVIRLIKEYPIERKTPLDYMNFLSDLRNMLNNE